MSTEYKFKSGDTIVKKRSKRPKPEPDVPASPIRDDRFVSYAEHGANSRKCYATCGQCGWSTAGSWEKVSRLGSKHEQKEQEQQDATH